MPNPPGPRAPYYSLYLGIFSITLYLSFIRELFSTVTLPLLNYLTEILSSSQQSGLNAGSTVSTTASAPAYSSKMAPSATTSSACTMTASALYADHQIRLVRRQLFKEKIRRIVRYFSLFPIYFAFEVPDM